MIVADIIGLIAFALSGVMIAAYKKLDIFGVFFIATLTALGGGVVRDVLAGRTPFAFSDYYPITVVMVTVVLALVFRLYAKAIDRKLLFVLFDSIGLCAFSITGALVGIEAGFNLFGIVILSISTAVGGGLIRDMLLNEIPFILKEEIYASVSIFIALGVFVLDRFGYAGNVSLSLLFFVMLALRICAYRFSIHLPKL